jgi:hypothetical protein
VLGRLTFGGVALRRYEALQGKRYFNRGRADDLRIDQPGYGRNAELFVARFSDPNAPADGISRRLVPYLFGCAFVV